MTAGETSARSGCCACPAALGWVGVQLGACATRADGFPARLRQRRWQTCGANCSVAQRRGKLCASSAPGSGEQPVQSASARRKRRVTTIRSEQVKCNQSKRGSNSAHAGEKDEPSSSVGTSSVSSAAKTTNKASESRERDQEKSSPPPLHAPVVKSLSELTEQISQLLSIRRSSESEQVEDRYHMDRSQDGSTTLIAVVFGKELMRDQLTVELSKRVITLVRLLRTGALRPDVICFTGARADGTVVSPASAAYTFFRQVCEELNIDLSDVSFVLEEKSPRLSKLPLHKVFLQVEKMFGRRSAEKCHFTLISSDYHLFHLQEVHRHTPRQSMLSALHQHGATWNFIFTLYPFCVSSQPDVSFRGRIMVLLNEISIVKVDVIGALEDGSFLARENLARLNHVMLKLSDMHRVAQGELNSKLRAQPIRSEFLLPLDGHFQCDPRDYCAVLEDAIYAVREAQRLLCPNNDMILTSNVGNLTKTKRLLAYSLQILREKVDPDRPLIIARDWNDILDDARSALPGSTPTGAPAAIQTLVDDVIHSDNSDIVNHSDGVSIHDTTTFGRIRDVGSTSISPRTTNETASATVDTIVEVQNSAFSSDGENNTQTVHTARLGQSTQRRERVKRTDTAASAPSRDMEPSEVQAAVSAAVKAASKKTRVRAARVRRRKESDDQDADAASEH
ncbi:hypothetical protein FVE85_4024 [Porphyridium purpureum]|uniref:DUF218 domain-containing protein n=1 Tax=Porphyridium purpureum TaxID=35688 RepID=A0A5J4YRE0_PORPP|nr:hypothetical protein FVE85_4024 [Porphyridium purpureum]|eukprot:POR6065..scf229_5